MSHAFDIQFARSTGLGSLFEVPANPFHWRGPGRLTIDPEWLVFARRRIWPFSRAQRRVPSAALGAVYREGDALRLEFAGSPCAVVQVWARSAAVAAEIVRLLPTDRTVELESAAAVPGRTVRRRLSVIVAGLVGLIIGGAAAWMRPAAPTLERRAAVADAPVSVPVIVSTPVVSTVSVVTEASRAATVGRWSPASLSSPRSAAIPVVYADPVAQYSDAFETGTANEAAPSTSGPRRTYGSATARNEPATLVVPHSNFFYAESAALQSAYLYGASPTDLEGRWWTLSERLYNSPEFEDGRLRPIVDAQLGVSLNWRASLAYYAAALDAGDRRGIDAARADLDAANELTNRVQRFSY